MTTTREDIGALGQGVYGSVDALRLINFQNTAPLVGCKPVTLQTVLRWVRGHEVQIDGKTHHSEPLWQIDYPAADDDRLELSFRDLIEIRVVKAFRDAGLDPTTIRRCFQLAAERIEDARPFSTRRFKTEGRTIFLDIIRDVEDDALINLNHRQAVFRSFVSPSLQDLDFETDIAARWFPLGLGSRNVLIDPSFAFGRPVSSEGHVPTQVLAQAVEVEGSPERVARLYEVPLRAVSDALTFESLLAA